MDEEKMKYLKKVMDEENLKHFGPSTPEFEKFFSTFKTIDHTKYMGPGTHLLEHYNINGVTMTPALTRGYFEARKLPMHINDIVLASHPKTGTTWVEEIMYLILNDCDIVKAKSAPIDVRVPYLEWPECTLKGLFDTPSPKFVKTHQPYQMLPDGDCNKKYKIVYTTRNPKDTAVSMYHFYKLIQPMCFVGDFKDGINLFLNDCTIFGPFHKHVLGYWNHRKDGNVLVVKYEDMHKDAGAQVKRIANFLEKPVTDEQVKFISNATSFQQMAANPQANHAQWETKEIANNTTKFMRKGKIGDWKNQFDEELNKKFDEYIAKYLSDTDLTYEYE